MTTCDLQADVFLAPQIAVATTRFKIDMVRICSNLTFLLFSPNFSKMGPFLVFLVNWPNSAALKYLSNVSVDFTAYSLL